MTKDRPRAPGAARRPASLIALGAICIALGGCLGRGPESTGSLASAAPEDRQKLVESLGRRFERDPADPRIAVPYARALRANGQTAQAVAVLQQTAIRNPKNLWVLGAYGKALAEAGRLREASDVLARAHTPDRPDWRILSAQGTVADGLGDFEGAQRFYEAALRLAPGEPSVLTNKGLSLALNRRLREAEPILREAAASPAADARVRQNLALVLGLEGKFPEAETVLKQDLSPTEAAESLASIREMVKQPDSWKALRGNGAGRLAGEPATKARQADAKPGAEPMTLASADHVAPTR